MVEWSNANLANRGVDIAVTLPTFNRASAAKKLAKRMLQGYEATSHKCPDCGVPLMSHRGIVRCVVCVEQLISATIDPSYSGSENDTGAALQESRNEESNGSVIRVTEDGIEISPRLSPESSVRHINTWAPNDNVNSDDIERMLEILDDGTPTEEPSASRGQSSSSWASDNMSSSAEFDVDEAVSHPHTQLSHLADKNKMPPKKYGPDVDVEIEKGDNEVSQDRADSRHRQLALLAAEIVNIDAEIEKGDNVVSHDTVGSKHRQLALLAAEIVDSTAPSVLISKGEKGAGEKSTENVEVEDAHLLEKNGERTNQLQQASGQADIADASTMDYYAKGKAFATKIIRETDSVLSDLVCSENQINVPTTKNRTSMSSASSGAMRVGAPQKRTTINNLAKERSAGQRKCYMPAWENSMKNFVLDDEDSLNDKGNEQPPTPSDGKAISHRDDFFDELRHRALMTKATLVQEKLEASGFVTKRTGTFAASSPMHAERNDHIDIRARESPLSTYANENVAHDASNAQPLKQGHHHGESGSRSELASLSPTKQTSEAELVNSIVPDDEKKYLALKCIREEKMVLPFDENINTSLRKSSLMLALTSSSAECTGNKNVSSSVSQRSHEPTPFANNSSSLSVDHAGSTKSCKQVDESLSIKENASSDVPNKNEISSGSSVLSQRSHKPTTVANNSSSSSVDHAGSTKSCKQVDESLSIKENASSAVPNKNEISSGSSVLSQRSHKPTPVTNNSSSSSVDHAGSTKSCKQVDESLSIKENASSDVPNKNEISSGSSVLSQRSHKLTPVINNCSSSSVDHAGTISSRKFQAGNDDNASSFRDATSTKHLTTDDANAVKEVLVANRMTSSAAANVSSYSSLSITSLSSSIQVQQNRIAQLEADALRKHREAELAAASAREALDVMVKARNDRKNKIKSKTKLPAGVEENPTIMEEKCVPKKADHDIVADKMVLQPNENKEKSANCPNEDVFSAASVSQYSHREIISNYQNRGSSNLRRMSDTQQFGDDGGCEIYDSSDESTIDSSTSDQISTSSSYLKKLRGASDKRKKDISSWSQNRKVGKDNHPITPEAPRTRRSMRPLSPRDYHEVDDALSESSESKCSIADSESSKSTVSTLDSSSRPSQFARMRHHAHEDSSRHRRSASASKRPMSERAMPMKSHLWLPSLTSSHPAGSKVSFESDTTPRRTSTTKLTSVQQLPSQHHRRSHLIPLPVRASKSMKPNHLLPYSPKSGFTNGTSRAGERLFEARRPAPLSRRAESEPFYPDHHYQRPMMSQHPRELHYSDNGYFLPGLLPKEPFSRPFANLDAGNPPSRFIANGPVPLQHGSTSLTPKSLHEKERYEFNHLPPTPRTFDSLQLAQHQTIGERMESMNQATMARNVTPLSLAHHQLIEENIALRNYQAMALQHFSGVSAAAAAAGQPFVAGGGHDASIAAGYHHPTSRPPQSGRFGMNYEQLDRRGISARGQQQPWQRAHYMEGSDRFQSGNRINY